MVASRRTSRARTCTVASALVLPSEAVTVVGPGQVGDEGAVLLDLAITGRERPRRCETRQLPTARVACHRPEAEDVSGPRCGRTAGHLEPANRVGTTVIVCAAELAPARAVTRARSRGSGDGPSLRGNLDDRRRTRAPAHRIVTPISRRGKHLGAQGQALPDQQSGDGRRNDEAGGGGGTTLTVTVIGLLGRAPATRATALTTAFPGTRPGANPSCRRRSQRRIGRETIRSGRPEPDDPAHRGLPHAAGAARRRRRSARPA
jgi:hypothetical protein